VRQREVVTPLQERPWLLGDSKRLVLGTCLTLKTLSRTSSENFFCTSSEKRTSTWPGSKRKAKSCSWAGEPFSRLWITSSAPQTCGTWGWLSTALYMTHQDLSGFSPPTVKRRASPWTH